MLSALGTHVSVPSFCVGSRRADCGRPGRARRASVILCACGSLPVGIDLGTTNSAIAVCDDGKVRLLLDPQGRETIPSVVSYIQVTAACASHACTNTCADTTHACVGLELATLL